MLEVFLSIVEYLFLNEVQELIGELDSKFDSEHGSRDRKSVV